MANTTPDPPENQVLAEILAKMCKILLELQVAQSQNHEENGASHESALEEEILDNI